VRPTRAHGRRTASLLLDTALALHAEQGPEAVTVPAVLTRSGASPGSLYHHFGSLSGLRAALYARCLTELLEALGAALGPADGAREGVHAVVGAYLRFTRTSPDVARYVHAASGAAFSARTPPVMSGDGAAALEAVRAWFRPHLAAGTLAALPEQLVEMLLIGPVAETARRWLAGDPAVDLDDAERLLPERVWRSLRA
jgi:AcrR family transcriptional regulator